MDDATIEHDVTLWIVNDIPARMFYAGRRWTVTDMPTRLRELVWTVRPREGRGMHGWRCQATDEQEESFVFDVFRAEDSWHLHRAYA
ncbi:hypothetical protein ACPW96_21360 [Micromonospora sp. DT81.3]|uniref:hypothetical protein n=1 Tax=Micromonospora sp. DT81.3 TaxID=3416523 RepID=UPI003CF7919A